MKLWPNTSTAPPRSTRRLLLDEPVHFRLHGSAAARWVALFRARAAAGPERVRLLPDEGRIDLGVSGVTVGRRRLATAALDLLE